jgi:hypothetical protein
VKQQLLPQFRPTLFEGIPFFYMHPNRMSILIRSKYVHFFVETPFPEWY